jgi:5-formyltetrahydrofolate cyclo-ligase
MMTKSEVTELIEETLAALPERMSGNEANPLVAEKLRSLITTDRKSVIEALKSYLAFRVSPEQRKPEDAVPEARIWMALDVAERLSLIELRPEIQSLVGDVRNRKVFLPVHEKSVARYLQRLSVSG